MLSEIAASAESGTPTPFDLVGIYHSVKSPVLHSLFSRLLSNSDPALSSVGLRGSVAAGDVAAIIALHQKYQTLATARGWGALVQEVSVYYANANSDSIDALGALSEDSQAGMDIRIAAADALARIHTPASLPHLARLLSESNSSLKSAAVGGISAFANNVVPGSHEMAHGPWPFRTEETIAHSAFSDSLIAERERYYVGFWQSWWVQNASSIAQ